MCAYRLFFRLTRVPSFLLLLLHLFGGSTWNVSRGGGGGGGGRREGGAGRRGGGGLAKGQELPSRDEGHFQFMMKHPEVIVDTKSLPDGKEEAVYLDKGKPTRSYTIMKNLFLLQFMKDFYFSHYFMINCFYLNYLQHMPQRIATPSSTIYHICLNDIPYLSRPYLPQRYTIAVSTIYHTCLNDFVLLRRLLISWFQRLSLNGR